MSRQAHTKIDEYGRSLTDEIDLTNLYNATLVLFDKELELTYEYIHMTRGEIQ